MISMQASGFPRSRRAWTLLQVGLCCAMAVAAVQGQEPPPQPPLTSDTVLGEARQAYDATNYEHARELLDAVIAGFGSDSSRTDLQAVVAAAYELRARTRFNLQDVEGARTDFRAMLLRDPSYLLSAQVTPRVLSLFEEVRKTTVGTVATVVMPADAIVTLDGARIAGELPSVSLVAGVHTLSAVRPGYASGRKTFTVVPGAALETITLDLERISSSLTITTSPAGIEVLVDGVSRGTTELDPEGKAEGGGLLSKRLVVAELPNGRHRVEFRRECFIGVEREVDMQRPSDYTVETTKLLPAVASVTVQTDAVGGTVFVDDAPRGAAPLVLDDICQGAHTIEVRSPFGRHLQRMDLKPGQKEVVLARLRPAFALVSDNGAAGRVRGGPDLRLAAEAAFQQTKGVTFVAPTEKRLTDLLGADQLPVDWLAYDALRRPMGNAATIGESARRDIGLRLTKSLDVQGIAALARDPGGDPADMLLILFAPGSTEPDVVRWRMDSPQATRDAIRQLDQLPALFRSSIGLFSIDVQDVDGAVVASVEAGGTAETAGIRPGDIVTGADGMPVVDTQQLLAAIGRHPSGQPLALDVRDRAGAAKKTSLVVQDVPNVVSLDDLSLPSNRLAVEFARLATDTKNPLDEAAIRLNLGVLAIRLRIWNDAIRELDRVAKLTGDGVLPAPLIDPIKGTAQYLLGVAAEGSGDTVGAERAWRVAAQSRSNLLTESGEPVKELSEQRLSATSGGPRRP
jgi:hypothetical protein